ncbi:MAG: helicase associated domain-containing protein [Prevotella sp.]|nr:helicase associated domain-containing protein [Candidatus Equicola stercoris]
MTNEERWHQNYELLKAYIEEHHHLPDKKKVENRGLLSWAKYQRKCIKAGTIDEKRRRMFEELMDSRSTEHTGGRRKKIEGVKL